MDDDEARYRLPRTVVPRRYDLVLEPDLEAVTFAGSEIVTVEVTEPVDEIVLNAADLDVGPGRLEGPGGTLEVSTIRLDPETERAHLLLSGTAEPGEWTLHLEFRGKLSEQLQGFYRSTYTDDAGVAHTIATTQFESTDARRAFPCWDEPDLKAVFGVTLVDAGRAPRDLERPRDLPRAGRARTRPRAVRRHDGDVDVPGRVRGGPARGHRTRRRRRGAAPDRVPARQGRPDGVRERGRGVQPAVLRRLLRDPVPGQEDGHGRAPGLRAGRDGEPRLRHLPREPPAGEPRQRDPARGRHGRRRDRARARAHVVRRPGDDALVERDLAERGVRDADGAAGGGRVPAGLGAVEPVPAVARDRVRGGRAREHAFDRVPRALARRRGRDVRHPHVHEGRGGAPDARAVPGRRTLPRRDPPVPGRAPVRQHRDARPVGRDREGHGRARSPDHGRLDLAGRVPAGLGAAAGREGRARAAPLPDLGRGRRHGVGRAAAGPHVRGDRTRARSSPAASRSRSPATARSS